MITYPDVLSVNETIEFSRIVARPFARIANALIAAGARQAEHRTYSYLLGADHVLMDIGLSRSDVQGALDGRRPALAGTRDFAPSCGD